MRVGHIRLFQDAKKLGDKLVVILNNDNWLKKKKGFVFMSQKERKELIEALEFVDEVVISSHGKNPKDMGVGSELKKIKPDILVRGGNKEEEPVPETDDCSSIGCKLVFGIGHGGKVQASSWLLERYRKLIKPNSVGKVAMAKHLSEIAKVLKGSKVKIPFDLKMKISDFMLDLMSRRKNFGLFIVLGWQDKWYKFTDISDGDQDIFNKKSINIRSLGHKSVKGRDIETTLNFDGAILINENGDILHSGVMVEGLRPKVIADKLRPGKFNDLSDQFGFRHKVHTRHLSAISASFVFHNSTVFTISEEANDLHIFEGGKIIYSIP